MNSHYPPGPVFSLPVDTGIAFGRLQRQQQAHCDVDSDSGL